ncbi:LOW QUALITY PROTEIN: hypothetical protein PHPALM_27826 [Phytophthora palmivora]|uniref:Uncharacterized protein n=1 Tax=Phytophthora palmivora TaxID=4796 RepID=A0A2P4XBM8_9STRA|nr:LOW QUALITY PROTEIN: hypothetical protein PHPALM_27826 [Phytophthora palmivora]
MKKNGLSRIAKETRNILKPAQSCKRSDFDVEEDEIDRPEFERSPKKYMKDTRQVLVVKEVISVKRRNASLKSQIQYVGIPEKDIPLVPQEAVLPSSRMVGLYVNDRLIHMHRENADVSSAVLVIDAVDSERGRNLRITVKRGLYVYNHLISPENYRHSPGIHQVSTQSPLIPAIAGWCVVYQYIRDNSNHQVNMTDVYDDAVVNCNLESPTNESSVHQSACGYTGLFQSHQDLCEILQPALTIVTTYPFGQVQLVQYSLIETTTGRYLAKCLDHFKRANEP